MKPIRKKLTVLLGALLCALLLWGCGGGEADSAAPLTLWYTRGDALEPALERLAKDYAREKPRGAPSLRLRAFEGEEALALALESGGADLLLCSHEQAFDLWEKGRLSASAPLEEAFPQWLRERCGGVGTAGDPLGAQLPLWCGEGGSPWACRELTVWLYQQLLNRGLEYLAQPEKDLFRKEYREFYNQLAEEVWNGSLRLGEGDSAALTERGELACALLPSAELTAHPDLPLSPMEGESLLAEGECLVSLSGRSAAFLRWLYSGDTPAELCLSAGLAPLTTQMPEPATALERALLAAVSRPLHLPGADSSYEQNRQAAEDTLRHQLEYLQ